MKKLIGFEFEDNIDPKYKQWAREAVEEFVGLFPEFKDCFSITTEESKSFFNRRQVEEAFKDFLQTRPDLDLESLISEYYEKQPDGMYLRKHSVEDMLRKATTNGLVDFEKWQKLKQREIQRTYKLKADQRSLSCPVMVSVSSKTPAKGYAYSGFAGPCISVEHFKNDKDYFKRTVIHELGHTFNMTDHAQTQTNTWGTHCTGAGCLGSKNGPAVKGASFCSHCMEGMRKEMHKIKEALQKAEQARANDNQAADMPCLNEQDFFAGLNAEEKQFLENYLAYIRNNGINRSPEDLLWDRVYLLEELRRKINADKEYLAKTNPAQISKYYLTIAKGFDWSKEEYKSKISPQRRKQLEMRTSAARQEITITDKPLSGTAEKSNDPLYKVQLRGILRDSAKAEKLEYSETPQKGGFRAELKSADGRKVRIEASSPQKISMVSQNAEGEKITPSFRRFMDIVSYAQLRHASVTFGDIESPEFKAKLMMACLYAEPPVRMKGAPRIDNEFLSQLSPQTAKTLHSAYYGKRIKNEKDSYKGLQRSQAERFLELNEKAKDLKPREWAEFFYHKDQLVGAIAMKDAQRRFQSPRPREAEWEQRTGYKPETLRHYENKRPGDASWKLHLDVTPNPNEPTTKALRQYLEKLDIDYKVCGGEENGKGITAYVGSYQDCFDLSIRLQMEFGDKVKLPAQYTDQFTQEMEFAEAATGRFMVAANYDPATKVETPVFDEVYPTTVRGISPARVEAKHSTDFLISNAKQMNLIPKETPDNYGAIEDAKQKYDFDVIENYVSHKLYAKHLGTFYYGADKDKFEKHLFADKLPEPGSMERRKWDMLADRYENFIKTNCPEKIDLMKKHIDGYKPIDFTKENTQQAQRHHSGQQAVRQTLAQNGGRP